MYHGEEANIISIETEGPGHQFFFMYVLVFCIIF